MKRQSQDDSAFMSDKRYDLIVNLNLAIVALAEDARHETCSRSLLLQVSHNEADSVNSASPKGFKW